MAALSQGAFVAASSWEIDARERVRAALRQLQESLVDLVARDADEGDAPLLVTDMLCDALGYDKYEDLTASIR